MTENTLQVAEPTENSLAPTQETTRNLERYVSPAVDIYEQNEGLVVVADLPGVHREDLDIEVKNDLLTLQAHARNLSQGNEIVREFEFVHFFRQFRLADTVDTNRIEAELKHGVLTLRLPKAEATKPRKIAVQLT